MKNNIEFLVGNKKFLNKTLEPFDNNVLDFLNELSESLVASKECSQYTDIRTFAFMCRKRNLEFLKKKYSSYSHRTGIGLLFHITPSNIPTSFAYSLLFGILSGNTNLIKVPSKKFPQIEILCKAIKVKIKKYKKIENFITIVRYSDNDEFTRMASLKCDGRLIWGGNNSINNIRKFSMKEISRDIAFADRNSLCVINSSKIISLSSRELKILVGKFYNDTFLVDQNACSSPHIIFWEGDKKKEAKNKFWAELFNTVKLKYDIQHAGVFYKYNRLISDKLVLKNFESYRKYGQYIHCIQLKNNMELKVDNLIAKWGYFYQMDVKNISEIFKYTNIYTQTLSYFGYTKNVFLKTIKQTNFRGVDRIVPIGQALDIGLLWDGYDIVPSLTKTIEIK